MTPRSSSIDTAVYWGIFLFAAVSATYLLVTFIQLSTREDTAFIASTNYRQQVRYATVQTSVGSMKITFLRSQAPAATRQFLRLAQSGFYDETKFYRFPGGVFIESGLALDASSEGQESSYIFKEYVQKTPMTRGLVAMPRRGEEKIDPRLVLIFDEDEQPVTSGAYVAFGRVIEGMAVADKIKKVSPNLNQGTPAPVSFISLSTD